MGTPEFAVPALRAVAEACEVVAVVTSPDRPKGRGQKLAESPVAEAAKRLHLPVIKPESMRGAATRAALAERRPDLFAVVAFGAILGPKMLAVPRLGSINLHGSLLPDFRGASPVARALWEGRATTGVTTLWMDESVDTGDMILSERVAIEVDDDAERLSARLARVGAPLLAESLRLAHAGKAPRIPQPSGSGSYAGKLEKADGIVDWTLDAKTVWNHQRAVTPWPGALTRVRGAGLTLLRTRPLERSGAPGTVLALDRDGVLVACGSGALRLERVKPESRSEMDAVAWARGARIELGEKLGS